MTSFDTGVFTLSLDFELIWGTRDYGGTETFREACEIERAVVVDRLLALFEKYDVSATWCTVGHLFLDHCTRDGGRVHPDVERVRTDPQWFDGDPASDEAHAPTFYGRTLVEKIRHCRVPQELGSHSFSHVIFDDPGCTREVAESEIAKCVEIAAAQNLTLRSFVYPRNRVAHLDVLERHGFTSYRGPEPQWYDKPWLPHPLQRIAHLASVVLALEPPVVLPERVGALWNVPGSMIFLPMHGIRRHIPASRRVVRAIKGLDRAAAERKIFHLWFHPTNMANELEAMFGALEEILSHTQALRAQDRLQVMTMEQVAAAAGSRDH